MYDRLADLPLRLEDYALGSASLETSSDFTRVTTTVELSGAGETGRGEDVGYEADDHRRFRAGYADSGLEVAGEYTLDSFSNRLDAVDLLPEPPERSTDRHYRRWAFESAALDLALRQGGATGGADDEREAGRPATGTNLGQVLDRKYDPVEFVVSTRLESADRLDEIREVDLKGHYDGTDVDVDPDPDLYRRVVEAFPDAVIEDPRVPDETRPVVESARDRVAWDAPITDVESGRNLPFEPRWLNVKPSRFGTLESLLETLAYCEERNIRCYGGGPFELGVGREQIQLLASLLYPDSPNDVAPGGYNAADRPPDLPVSPLEPPAEPAGFRC
jgi:hypothetical protein